MEKLAFPGYIVRATVCADFARPLASAVFRPSPRTRDGKELVNPSHPEILPK